MDRRSCDSRVSPRVLGEIERGIRTGLSSRSQPVAFAARPGALAASATTRCARATRHSHSHVHAHQAARKLRTRPKAARVRSRKSASNTCRHHVASVA
eukprot:213605-Rhodomonas_salina.1